MHIFYPTDSISATYGNKSWFALPFQNAYYIGMAVGFSLLTFWNEKLHWEKCDSHKGYGLTVHKRPSKSSLAKSTSTRHYSFPAYVVSHLHYWIKAVTTQQKAHWSLLMKGAIHSSLSSEAIHTAQKDLFVLEAEARAILISPSFSYSSANRPYIDGGCTVYKWNVLSFRAVNLNILILARIRLVERHL